jgi:hypothetical protein
VKLDRIAANEENSVRGDAGGWCDWLMSPPPLAPMHAVEGAETYRNDTFQVVLVRLKCGLIHLSIKRFDQEPIRDWRGRCRRSRTSWSGQSTKAFELYPAEEQLVDTLNAYLPLGPGQIPTERFPVRLRRRRRVGDSDERGPINRAR